MLNQTRDVEKYLIEHGEITSMDAFELFGATRLSAIIFNLKKEGHIIDSVRTTGRNRYGRITSYTTYKWQGKEKNYE